MAKHICRCDSCGEESKMKKEFIPMSQLSSAPKVYHLPQDWTEAFGCDLCPKCKEEYYKIHNNGMERINAEVKAKLNIGELKNVN